MSSSFVSGQVEIRSRSVLLQTHRPSRMCTQHTCMHDTYSMNAHSVHTCSHMHPHACMHTHSRCSVSFVRWSSSSFLVAVGKTLLNCWSRVTRRASASPSGPWSLHSSLGLLGTCPEPARASASVAWDSGLGGLLAAGASRLFYCGRPAPWTGKAPQ